MMPSSTSIQIIATAHRRDKDAVLNDIDGFLGASIGKRPDATKRKSSGT
jgi:hypothetical protein